MEEVKEYLNVDLVGSEEEFTKSLQNTLVGSSFEEQLEWAMLMISGKFKQFKFSEDSPLVTVNHFDKSYLLHDEINKHLKFFSPLSDLQATPEIFPNLNIKGMSINNTIQLNKIKEIDPIQKRKLHVTKKHAYELTTAIYKQDTESFYGIRNGYELNKNFFNPDKTIQQMSDYPSMISLNPKYIINAKEYDNDAKMVADISKTIAMAYNIAMSVYYEWSIYIKEYNNIGFIIPIDPIILSEIYKTSMVKFESRKRMIHFVSEHYRKNVSLTNSEYDVFVSRHLRGNLKFEHNGFLVEIIPPKYDLNRIKTSKKFIDPNSD